MGIFSSLFGSSSNKDEPDNAKFNTTNSSDNVVRSTRYTYDDEDKGSGKHETTFSKTTPDKHEEGWYGKDYKKQ